MKVKVVPFGIQVTTFTVGTNLKLQNYPFLYCKLQESVVV